MYILKKFYAANSKYSEKEAYDKMHRMLGRNLICKLQKQKNSLRNN